MGSGNKTAGKSARRSNTNGSRVSGTMKQTSGHAHQPGENSRQMGKKRRKKNRWKKGQSWIGLLIVLLLALFGYREYDLKLPSFDVSSFGISGKNVSLSEIPEYSGSPYVEINGNEPDFSKSDFTADSFDHAVSMLHEVVEGPYRCLIEDLSIQDDKDLENEELEDIRIHSVAVAFQLTYFETRYDAESEEGLELEPEETQAPSGLANADVSNLQRSDLETAAEAALGE